MVRMGIPWRPFQLADSARMAKSERWMLVACYTQSERQGKRQSNVASGRKQTNGDHLTYNWQVAVSPSESGSGAVCAVSVLSSICNAGAVSISDTWPSDLWGGASGLTSNACSISMTCWRVAAAVLEPAYLCMQANCQLILQRLWRCYSLEDIQPL